MKIVNASRLILLIFLVSVALSSCSRGYGCAFNDQAHVEMGKDGKLPKTRGNSSLFPKDMNKKRKKRK